MLQWVEENPDADPRDGTRPAAVVSRAKAADNIVARGDWQAALKIVNDALDVVDAIPMNLWPFLAETLSKTQNEKLTTRVDAVGKNLISQAGLIADNYGKAAKR